MEEAPYVIIHEVTDHCTLNSVRRSNCYIVWGADVTNAAHASSRSNVDLEIGCLIDVATGLLTFTAHGKEIATSYQVRSARGVQLLGFILCSLY